MFSAAPIDAATIENGDVPEGGEPELSNHGLLDSVDFGQREKPLLDPNDLDGPQPRSGGSDPNDELFASSFEVEIDPRDRMLAFYSFAGGTDPAIRKASYGVHATGWETFLEGNAQSVLDAGVNRMVFFMPFGSRSYVTDPDTGEVRAAPGQAMMQFDAYLDAQRELPTLTDDFVESVRSFIDANTENGLLEEAIVYIGSPRLDPDQNVLQGQQWWDRAYEILTPILDAGFRSIGFDASGPALPDTLDFQLHEVLRDPSLRDPVRDARLIELIGDDAVEIYLEASPYRATGRSDFRLMLYDYTWERQDPERPGSHSEWRRNQFFEHDEYSDEVVRIIRSSDFREQGSELLANALAEGNSIALAPGALVGNGRWDLADVIENLDVPSLPTVIDLDPDDLNADDVQYQITFQPRHGTLTFNEHHADVFTYTPDAYFTGTDYFEYVVTNSEGASERAVVTLEVASPLGLSRPLSVADFNHDGDVDQADFRIWQANFGKQDGSDDLSRYGDADRDGDVDGADFLVWQREVGRSGGAGSGGGSGGGDFQVSQHGGFVEAEPESVGNAVKPVKAAMSFQQQIAEVTRPQDGFGDALKPGIERAKISGADHDQVTISVGETPFSGEAGKVVSRHDASLNSEASSTSNGVKMYESARPFAEHRDDFVGQGNSSHASSVADLMYTTGGSIDVLADALTSEGLLADYVAQEGEHLVDQPLDDQPLDDQPLDDQMEFDALWAKLLDDEITSDEVDAESDKRSQDEAETSAAPTN